MVETADSVDNGAGYGSNDLFFVIDNPVRDSQRFENRFHAADVVSIPFVGLCTTLQQIQTKRPQVRRILKAEIEALRYLHGDPKGTVDVIRKRFAMDESLAAEAYAVVSRAFSRDSRTARQALDTLIEMEKKDNQVPQNITAEQIYDPSLVEEALKELGG